MKPVEVLLSRLDKVRRNGEGKWVARCPAHDDNSPSLSVTEKEDGLVLVHCFAGCGGSDVVAAVGLELSDLFPKRPYTEYQGRDDWNPRRKPAPFVEERMQEEIYRLRAKVNAQ